LTITARLTQRGSGGSSGVSPSSDAGETHLARAENFYWDTAIMALFWMNWKCAATLPNDSGPELMVSSKGQGRWEESTQPERHSSRPAHNALHQIA
jgi:hypothetical protein